MGVVDVVVRYVVVVFLFLSLSLGYRDKSKK